MLTEQEYDAVAAELDSLAVREEGTLSPAEQERLEKLTAQIEEYDQAHFPD